MAIIVKDTMKDLSPGRRKRIEARTAELVKEHMTKSDHRRSLTSAMGRVSGIVSQEVVVYCAL